MKIRNLSVSDNMVCVEDHSLAQAIMAHYKMRLKKVLASRTVGLYVSGTSAAVILDDVPDRAPKIWIYSNEIQARERYTRIEL